MRLEGGQPGSPEATHEGCLMAQDRLHPECRGEGTVTGVSGGPLDRKSEDRTYPASEEVSSPPG